MAGKTKREKGLINQGTAGSFLVRLWKNMQKNWILYVMILPVVAYYAVFAYAPMYGMGA